MRVLIAEEALQTGAGHWPGYIGGIAGGLRAAGDHVDVLAHRNVVAPLLEAIGCKAHFSRNCFIDKQCHGSIGGIRHALTYRRELLAHLNAAPPYDWILALTMRLQHLLAFALMRRRLGRFPNTRVLLLFVLGFGRYRGPGQARCFNRKPSTLISRMAIKLLNGGLLKGQVILAAETKGMQDELGRFAGFPVTLFPHPVEEALSGSPDIAVCAELEKRREGRIVVACPGFARHEKGSDLFYDAARHFLKNGITGRLLFILQWPRPIAMPDGTLLKPDNEFAGDPSVLLINENLDPATYAQVIESSDLIALPYRESSYQLRVSRVAIDAAIAGKPILYAKGTWIGEVAELAGCRVEIQSESPQALLEALQTATSRIAQLRKKARAGAVAVKDYYSVGSFRNKLLGLVSNQTARGYHQEA